MKIYCVMGYFYDSLGEFGGNVRVLEAFADHDKAGEFDLSRNKETVGDENFCYSAIDEVEFTA